MNYEKMKFINKYKEDSDMATNILGWKNVNEKSKEEILKRPVFEDGNRIGVLYNDNDEHKPLIIRNFKFVKEYSEPVIESYNARIEAKLRPDYEIFMPRTNREHVQYLVSKMLKDVIDLREKMLEDNEALREMVLQSEKLETFKDQDTGKWSSAILDVFNELVLQVDNCETECEALYKLSVNYFYNKNL